MRLAQKKKYKILIADDETLECQSMRLFLSRTFPQLELLEDAMNGSEVVESVLNNEPDILILDIEMPGLNGLDALRLLREKGNTVRVVIKTAYSKFVYAQDAIQLKVDSYLLKPVKKKDLSDAIGLIIDDLDSVKLVGSDISNSGILLMAQSAFVATMVRNSYVPGLLDYYASLLNIKFGSGFLALVSFNSNPDINGEHFQDFLHDLVGSTSIATKILVGSMDEKELVVFTYSESILSDGEYQALSRFVSSAVKTSAKKLLGVDCNVFCGELTKEKLQAMNSHYFDSIRYGAFAGSSPNMKEVSQHLKKAIAYINLHYMEDISLNQLANYLDLSPNYVSGLFSSELKKTYVDYLTDVRMLNAIVLIKQGVVNIQDLSDRVGYAYPSYFSKIFKQYTGYTVSDFKRLKQGCWSQNDTENT